MKAQSFIYCLQVKSQAALLGDVALQSINFLFHFLYKAGHVKI